MNIFKQMISDWTNEGYDPFAAPMETGTPWGVKHGDNDKAVGRQRVTARRMVGLPGDTPFAPIRTAIRSTACLKTCRRTSRRFIPNRASKTKCPRLIFSPTCRARM